MKQDDYFLNQIDILGRILGKAVADLLHLNSSDNILQIEAIKEEIENGLNFDFDEIEKLTADEFLKILLENSTISVENLEKLAESFQLISLKSSYDLNSKALTILKYVDSVSKIYSAERIYKIKQLENLIQ